MAKANTIEVEFTLDSAKTKVIKYNEVDADGNVLGRGDDKVLGSIYVSKAAMKQAGLKKVPRNITVTINL